MVKPIDAQNVDLNIGDKMKFCPRCGSKNIGWPLPHDRQKWNARNVVILVHSLLRMGKWLMKLEKNILKIKKILRSDICL